MSGPINLQGARMGELARRIECEFREMPGLRLTRWQAARLWNLADHECEVLLEALVRARVLRETPHGFVRHESGES